MQQGFETNNIKGKTLLYTENQPLQHHLEANLQKVQAAL